MLVSEPVDLTALWLFQTFPNSFINVKKGYYSGNLCVNVTRSPKQKLLCYHANSFSFSFCGNPLTGLYLLIIVPSHLESNVKSYADKYLKN